MGEFSEDERVRVHAMIDEVLAQARVRRWSSGVREIAPPAPAVPAEYVEPSQVQAWVAGFKAGRCGT